MTGSGLLNIVPAGMPWAAAIIAIGACLAMLLKAWSVLRKVELDGGGAMRGDLMARIGHLETRIADLEKLLSQEQARHAAEMEDVRHELSNETASLDAFILLAEANPARVLEQLPKIKEMRARHKERVAMRRGIREGAVIAATTGSAE